jgi:hypothetical protein
MSIDQTNWCWTLIEWAMDYGMCLPLTLTMSHKIKVVRVLGLLLMFGWFLPIGLLLIPVMVLLMIASLFEETWRRPV